MSKRCVECGHQVGPWEHATVPYDSALLGVVLSGEIRSVCPNCGEEYIRIANPRAIRTQLVRAVVDRTKERRLRPDEIRFLRKSLGWSGRDFARAMDTTPESVSKWENGKRACPVPVQRALRLEALLGSPITDYEAHDATTPSQPERLELRLSDGQWETAAA